MIMKGEDDYQKGRTGFLDRKWIIARPPIESVVTRATCRAGTESRLRGRQEPRGRNREVRTASRNNMIKQRWRYSPKDSIGGKTVESEGSRREEDNLRQPGSARAPRDNNTGLFDEESDKVRYGGRWLPAICNG